uniref:Uncharacterized protein n=1 Tax=Micrurus corallinus TaxID=54390 RepID=A0A2D4EUV3_MICCO
MPLSSVMRKTSVRLGQSCPSRSQGKKDSLLHLVEVTGSFTQFFYGGWQTWHYDLFSRSCSSYLILLLLLLKNEVRLIQNFFFRRKLAEDNPNPWILVGTIKQGKFLQLHGRDHKLCGCAGQSVSFDYRGSHGLNSILRHQDGQSSRIWAFWKLSTHFRIKKTNKEKERNPGASQHTMG